MKNAQFPANLFVSADLPLCYGVLAEPPTQEVSVGYRSWQTTDRGEEMVSCRTDYFVRPDGSARIHREDEDGVEEQILPPGTWAIDRMYGSFGSRGGREIAVKGFEINERNGYLWWQKTPHASQQLWDAARERYLTDTSENRALGQEMALLQMLFEAEREDGFNIADLLENISDTALRAVTASPASTVRGGRREIVYSGYEHDGQGRRTSDVFHVHYRHINVHGQHISSFTEKPCCK